jgi:phage recombination protein Bet
VVTTAITKQASNGVGIERWGMTRDQLDLLKRTIAKGTSDDEFALFMSTAQRLGLDPFAKQIYAVMRFDKREERKVMSVQVSIDGFRSIADKTGECDGQDGPMWCGEDGAWKDVWLHERPPSAAKVIVYRKGQTRGYTGIATYDSYIQEGPDGNPNNMWRRLPDTMVAKCAESLALRKAFPAQLAGIYTPEEMGQADNPDPPPPVATRPEPPKTDRAAPVEIELDAAGMVELLGRINGAKSYDDLDALAPTLAKLVQSQKELARATWRAKMSNERWSTPRTEGSTTAAATAQ